MNKRILVSVLLLGAAAWAVTSSAQLAVGGNQASAGVAKVANPDASCFQQTFAEKNGDKNWIVKTCELPGSSITYRIDVNDQQLGSFKKTLKFAGDGGSEEPTFRLLSSDTLLIDMAQERGGTAVLVHVAKEQNRLSSLNIDYDGEDEDSLSGQQKGNVIHLKTKLRKITVTIDSTGNLSKNH